MPQRTAMIGSLPEALGMVKAMRADGLEWGTDCRQAVRRAPAGIIRDRMAEDVESASRAIRELLAAGLAASDLEGQPHGH